MSLSNYRWVRSLKHPYASGKVRRVGRGRAEGGGLKRNVETHNDLIVAALSGLYRGTRFERVL